MSREFNDITYRSFILVEHTNDTLQYFFKVDKHRSRTLILRGDNGL